MKISNRFDIRGNCKCEHIKNKTCSQCSACIDCEYYIHNENKIYVLPGQYYHTGKKTIVNKVSMCN